MSTPILLTIGILLLLLFWIVADPRPVKNRYGKKTVFVYSIVIVVIGPQIAGSVLFPVSIPRFEPLFVGAGVVIYLTGVVLALWAKKEMGLSWGLPAEHDIKRQKKLITTGPFSFSRNPIYVGLFFIALGYAIALKSIFILILIPLHFYFRHVAIVEEKLLEKHFGVEFKEYKSRVLRFLFGS